MAQELALGLYDEHARVRLVGRGALSDAPEIAFFSLGRIQGARDVHDKRKPAARQGRKAQGPPKEVAGPPKGAFMPRRIRSSPTRS